jgi:hypothetical protein
MGLVKYDHPPLLAPGRHYLSLTQIEAQFVQRFDGESRSRREKLFYALEDFLQKLLVAKIRCDAFIDGSFLTEKLVPDDVDVFVVTEFGVFETLSEDQHQLLESINIDEPPLVPLVDGWSVTAYPRDHPRYGTVLDGGNPGEGFGIEHGQYWLKGYIVIRLWETDVRNRLCR